MALGPLVELVFCIGRSFLWAENIRSYSVYFVCRLYVIEDCHPHGLHFVVGGAGGECGIRMWIHRGALPSLGSTSGKAGL